MVLCLTKVNSIQVDDTLATDKSINIEAYQLSIIDKKMTTDTLSECKLLFDDFEELKLKLKEELKEILWN